MANTQDNLNDFYAKEAVMGSFAPALLSGRSIYRFGSSSATLSTTRIPMHIRTGPQSFGNPTERKRFTQLEFHGRGSVWVRVYVDGVWICEGAVTLTETPSKIRRFGIPTGTRGYALDLEFSGDVFPRVIETEYKPMSSTS